MRWRFVVSFTARKLYPLGNNPRYTLNMRLEGPTVVLDAVEKRRIFDTCGESNPSFSVV
jgi:hypothetical protein